MLTTTDHVKTDSIITIAIDFGTTFSAVAWHWTHNPDVVEVIKDWPNTSGHLRSMTDEKVPTKLAYKQPGGLPLWGFQVFDPMPHYREFKLSLGDVNNSSTGLSKTFPEPLALTFTDQFNPTKLTTDYLKLIKEHTLTQIKTKVDTHIVDTTPIEWLVTVPAIWTDRQNNQTRSCAEQAGFTGNISLVSEPEAAAIHAISTMEDEEVSAGDIFVLCDCGGGTADVITYIIEQIEPVTLRELVRGAGDRCGGVYVDRAFAHYIKDKFSKCDGWSEKVLVDAVQKFEIGTKRKFDDEDDQVILKLSGLGNDHRKSIKKDKATVSSAVIRALFDPAVQNIIRLVQEQISVAKSKQASVKAVLLVGGFGQSPYLKREIEKGIGAGIDVWQVKDGRTAVVQGAVLKSLNDTDPDNATVQIASRVARRCYGVSRGIKYDARRDNSDRKYWVEVENCYYIQVAHWFIFQDTQLPANGRKSFGYHEIWPVGDRAPNFSVHILVWDGPSTQELRPPKYDEAHLHLTQLNVDLSRIPPDKLEKHWNRAIGKECYHCYPQVAVTYGSTGLEYVLSYKGTSYGRVEAKYS